MSKTADIWAHLEGGKTLTAAEAARRFNCYALHSRAAELRDRGHKVICRRIERKGKPIWEYSLK